MGVLWELNEVQIKTSVESEVRKEMRFKQEFLSKKGKIKKKQAALTIKQDRGFLRKILIQDSKFLRTRTPSIQQRLDVFLNLVLTGDWTVIKVMEEGTIVGEGYTQLKYCWHC